MSAFQFHPIANVFPLMGEAELAELAADIREHGLREPVILLDRQILDGRNRYRACLRAGVEPEFTAYGSVEKYDDEMFADSLHDCRERRRVFVQLDDHYPAEEGYWCDFFGEMQDPLAYVVSLNLRRRHLDESQRAMVASKIANLGAGRPPKADGPGLFEETAPIEAVSQSAAADMLNVGRRSVQRAATVRREGVPELVEAVERGEIAVAPAAEIARKPPEEQRRIVQLPTASEARKQARETGRGILARDGREYDGRTVEQERVAASDTKLFFQLINALEAIATMPVTPDEYIERLPDHDQAGRYLDQAVDQHLRGAADWLRGFTDLWGEHREQREVA